MGRPILRILALIAPAFALSACGSGREAQLEQQLAKAKAQAQEQAEARAAAEREAAAARDQARQAALSDFYSGSEGDEGYVEDAPDADSAPADDAPPPDPGLPAIDA
ncbi:hypothetical protein [Novosphingobium mathurense]|uniref:Uncharacterized protein n=1 Tax=Novosphingobium mathurense TaxID=428990 RepID=A0A1U6GUU6_9SPHN|nr:hypothetical protein [Novosphingobium mathurense]SLJ87313.1 hypothetical protein SAMN06295987_101538 [Novosphingobium mathurense]